MEFVRLTHNVLRELHKRGYTVLRSPLPIDNADPTWYAEKVADVWDYLDDLASVPFKEPNVLIIRDALDNMSEEELRGSVWVP